MFVKRFWFYLWAMPTTAVGAVLALAALATGGKMHVVNGVAEVSGGFVSFFLRRCTLLRGGASAMTLGHIVIGRDQACLDWSRDHERIHVRQCERWGPLFIPAYLAACAVAWARGKHPYRDNVFEREAYGD
jgi:hypothetical protein